MVRALCLDCSALSISVTQVAMVSLVVSASVCVSWYQSSVSMSVRPTHFDPDPVSPPFPTPLSPVVSALVCIVSPNPQIPWYGGGISTIFPGHRCLCLARCVCKFLHGEGDKHTGSHIYRSHHMAACLCKRINSVQLSCLSASRIQSWCSFFQLLLLWVWLLTSQRLSCIRDDKSTLRQVTVACCMLKNQVKRHSVFGDYEAVMRAALFVVQLLCIKMLL